MKEMRKEVERMERVRQGELLRAKVTKKEKEKLTKMSGEIVSEIIQKVEEIGNERS